MVVKNKITTACSNWAGVAAIVLPLALCGGARAAETNTAIEAALQHPARPSQDLKLDQVRKPAEVLEFFQIEPGMRVLDVFAGPGYYTEILSRLVGGEGSVTMYNHAPWEAYSKAGSDARVEGGRLDNVTTQFEDINTLKLPADHYDASVIILGLHDLYHRSEKSVSGDELNTSYFLRALYAGMKPGGIVGVIEHEAKPGSDPYKTADELERLGSDHVLSIMTEAGFILEAQSSILRNNFDDYSKGVFDPAIRRKTDRAVMRFRKPA